MVQRRYRNFAPRRQNGSLWWLHVPCPQCIWDRSIRRLEAVTVFEVNWEDARHHFSGPRGECWPIDLFCVDPDLQGKGFGQALPTETVGLWLTREVLRLQQVSYLRSREHFNLKFGFEKVGRSNVGANESSQGWKYHVLCEAFTRPGYGIACQIKVG